MLRYKLNFFLADDSIEVRDVYEKNSGRDPFPYLVKRGRIPRDFSDKTKHDLIHGRNEHKYVRFKPFTFKALTALVHMYICTPNTFSDTSDVYTSMYTCRPL